MDGKALLNWWGRAKAEKEQFHLHYDDLARVMLPRRLGFAQDVVEGQRRTDDIYDGTPMQAANSLANSIGGMMRPKGVPDFSMSVEDDKLNNLPIVKDWLYKATEVVKREMLGAYTLYHQTCSEVDLDLVVFGTGVFYIGESRKRDSLLYRSCHLRDATPYWDEEGQCVGMFYRRAMTLRQAKGKFGQKKLSETLQRKFVETDVNLEEKVKFLQVVVPREDAKPFGLFAKNLPWAEYWIEIDTKHIAQEGGYHEFPFPSPRFDTTSGENMGRSPGMIALPDSETLQAMGETILVAGQRMADPPLGVPNDGAFSAVNTFPGGLTYYDVETAQSVGGNPFFEIGNKGNLPIARDMQQDARAQVMNAFFKNVLNLPIDGPEMTATEIIARKEEFLREMGPLYGRFDHNYNAPTMERTFMLLLRGGKLPPIPQELSGANIVFEYDSPTKKIRKQIEIAAADMWVDRMYQIAAVDPRAKMLVNAERYGRLKAEIEGIPHEVVNTPDEVNALQQASDAAMMQQQQMDQLAGGAQIVKTGAEAVNKLAAPKGAAPTNG